MPEKSLEELAPAALVTAAAKRIGRSLAIRLAECGFDIALHFNTSQKDAEETAELIKGMGRRCHVFKADLCSTGETERLIPSALKEFPNLCLLINNASIWEPGNFIDSSVEELQRNFKLHLEAPYILSRDFARLAEQGQIINILDSNIARYQTAHFAYLLSKKALHEFTLLAASELAPKIRVNAIAPGAVLVPEDDRKPLYENKFRHNPLKQAGSPEDVSDAMEFLIRSKHITGQCIYVSAGKHLT